MAAKFNALFLVKRRRAKSLATLLCWIAALTFAPLSGYCAADADADDYQADAPAAAGRMHIDSFDGPVTKREIDSFVGYIQTLTPAQDNHDNQWAQGHSGEALKAMGLVYEISGNQAILDRMIVFCDALLAARNDLASAPVGQYRLWTGGIDPAWPNDVSKSVIQTGGEQGDPVGHLGNCARLILSTHAILNLPVTGGDPYAYGVTYLARAKKYVAEADRAVDGHILRSLLDLSDHNRYRFSSASPYQTGKPVPWNQQMMFNYGFQNLAACHALLRDDPRRVARYDAIVKTNLDWFLSAGVKPYRDNAGNIAYNWAYAAPKTEWEDSNHGSLDMAGLVRAYASGRYGIRADQMLPFANAVIDMMTLGPNYYAGRVDGSNGVKHGAPTKYIRSGYLLLAAFRPDAYAAMMGANMKAGGDTGSIDQFSRFLWVKNLRAHQA